jgi:hypothetical protein
LRGEIAEIVSGFGVAARLAREGWHDGVEGARACGTRPSLVVAPPATGADRAGASPTTRSLLCHSTLAAGAP